MTRLLLIDNYDSFTYNLLHYFAELGATVEVVRNDAISAQDVIAQQPDGVVISPGPSDPDHAGICLETVQLCGEAHLPLLGVCLGHQCLGQVYGGKVVRAPEPVHGKTSPMQHQGTGVFENLPEPFVATRYHSLVVERTTLPAALTITAQTDDGLIMGLQHATLPLHGVQFHPESIASTHGHTLLQNFLNLL